MIQSDIVTILQNDANVSALVSTRIYPLRMPQGGSLPSVVYQRVSTDPVVSLDGDSNLDNVRVQFTCWATSYSGALDLAGKVRDAINGSTLKSITNLIIDTEDPETKNYGVIIDISVWG